jgi:hypothetical protein
MGGTHRRHPTLLVYYVADLYTHVTQVYLPGYSTCVERYELRSYLQLAIKSHNHETPHGKTRTKTL